VISRIKNPDADPNQRQQLILARFLLL